MLKFGTNNIGKVFAGTSTVASVYSGSNLIYQNVAPPAVINVSRMSSNVYVSSTSFSNCSFVMFKVWTGNKAGTVTFGSVTKNIAANTETEIAFGSYPHDGSAISDDGTPSTGDVTLIDIKGIDVVKFNSAKSTSATCVCINSIVNWGGIEEIGTHTTAVTATPFFGSFTSVPTSVSLGGRLKTVYNSVFYGHSTLTSLSIGSYLSSLDHGTDPTETNGLIPFASCNSITSITVSSGNSTFTSSNNVLMSKDEKTIYYMPANVNAESFPMTYVTTIQRNAYRPTHTLSTNTLSGIRIFFSNAVNGLSNVTSLYLDNINVIGTNAVLCPNLTTLRIGGNITFMGNSVVTSTLLTSLTINSILTNVQRPTTVGPIFTSIGKSTTNGVTITFNRFGAIPNQTFAGNTASDLSLIYRIVNANNITAIGNNAFKHCDFSQLGYDINFENITTLSPYAFSWSATTVSSGGTITTTITTPTKFAPSNRNITFGSMLTNIGTAALFSLCKARVHFQSTYPPTLTGNAIFGPTDSGELDPSWSFFVPRSSLNLYQTATYWTDLASYMQGE